MVLGSMLRLLNIFDGDTSEDRSNYTISYDKNGNQVRCVHHPGAPLYNDQNNESSICTQCQTIAGKLVSVSGSETFMSEVGDLLISSDGRRYTLPIRRRIIQGMVDVNSHIDQMNCSTRIKDKAIDIYKKLQQHQTELQRRFFQYYSAACVHIALSEEGFARTLKETSRKLHKDHPQFSRCVEAVREILKLHENLEETERNFMERFCIMLRLSRKVTDDAFYILEKAKEYGTIIGSRSPTSMVAVSIYMASQESSNKKSLNEVSHATGVAESTIKTIHQIMDPLRSELFPQNFNFELENVELLSAQHVNVNNQSG